jgi:hypothetical protein
VAGRTRPGFGRVAFGTSWTERLEGNRATDAAGARWLGLRGGVEVRAPPQHENCGGVFAYQEGRAPGVIPRTP